MRQFLTMAGILPHVFVKREDIAAHTEQIMTRYMQLVYEEGVHTSKTFKQKGDEMLREKSFKALMIFLRVCAKECETHIFVKRTCINKCKSKQIEKTYTELSYRLLT